MRTSSLLFLAAGAFCSVAAAPFHRDDVGDCFSCEQRSGPGYYYGGGDRYGRYGYGGGYGDDDFGYGGGERYGYGYDDDDESGDFGFRDYDRYAGYDNADRYDGAGDVYDYDHGNYGFGFGDDDIKRYRDYGARYSDRREREASDVTSCRSLDKDELGLVRDAEFEKDEERCFEKGFRFNRGVKYDRAFGFRRDKDSKFDLDAHNRNADAKYYASGYFDEENDAKVEEEDDYFKRISFYDPGRYRELDYY